jgi:hypothetical protein
MLLARLIGGSVVLMLGMLVWRAISLGPAPGEGHGRQWCLLRGLARAGLFAAGWTITVLLYETTVRMTWMVILVTLLLTLPAILVGEAFYRPPMRSRWVKAEAEPHQPDKVKVKPKPKRKNDWL